MSRGTERKPEGTRIILSCAVLTVSVVDILVGFQNIQNVEHTITAMPEHRMVSNSSLAEDFLGRAYLRLVYSPPREIKIGAARFWQREVFPRPLEAITGLSQAADRIHDPLLKQYIGSISESVARTESARKQDGSAYTRDTFQDQRKGIEDLRREVTSFRVTAQERIKNFSNEQRRGPIVTTIASFLFALGSAIALVRFVTKDIDSRLQPSGVT